MRNNENGNSRSGRSAAAVRLVLLALIFVTVFAVVLSCGTGTETPLFGSVTDNVAEADRTAGSTTPYDIPATAWSGGTTPTIATVQAGFHPENSSGSPHSGFISDYLLF